MSDSSAEYEAEVEVLHDVMMPMRDGVGLATDVYLPRSREGASLPALMTRTPYDKSAAARPGRIAMFDFGYYFAAHGYAVIVQDVRGRYASDGVWGFLEDTDDGVDACAWIGSQSWSNGKVGMWGTSYPGGAQHAIAMAGAPELATVIPVDAVSNMGYHGMRHNGAFELRFWNWVFTGGNNVTWEGRHLKGNAELLKMSEDRLDYLQRLPLRAGETPLTNAPEYERWLVDAMDHPANDGFWDEIDIIDFPERYADIPVYLVGGWYDSWGSSTSANFQKLTAQLKSDVYLIMGPWVHGQHAFHSHGQVEFGEEAAIADPMTWRHEWFDRWLKDADNSVGKSAPFATKVRIFVMGTGDGRKTKDGLLNHGGFWREEQEWPLARTRPSTYYLRADGSLSLDLPAEEEPATEYDFDPNNPVPSIGGNVSSAEGILIQGAYDQRGGEQFWNGQDPAPLSSRDDVLVFQTEPLADDLEVTGQVEVSLWAASSAVDTDFTAKLIDVHPPSEDFPEGFDLQIEDGIIRGRFRDSLKQETLLKPGEAYEFKIKLYPTSNVFKKGHRIRLDVSSSNFPRFDVNPNTGEPLNRHTSTVVARNTIFQDTKRPSRVVLPVIPG